MEKDTDWFDVWFESPWYEKIYDHRDESEAKEAIDLLLNNSRLAQGAKVLDLCCGFGRHSAALAACGFRVTGIDGSDYLISRAKKDYSGSGAHFYVCDMREAYPEAPFDCIVNMFTSFGYFDDPAGDERVLTRVNEALRPGGYFMMDFLHSAYVRERLVPESISYEDGTRIVQRRRIEGNFVKKDIIIGEGVDARHYEEQVHLYTPEELERKITEAGIKVEKIFGNYRGESLSALSQRCIILGRKHEE